jgi:large subunit ribosomal protein L30
MPGAVAPASLEKQMANQRTDSKGGVVKVTLLRSPIGFNRNQATVVRSLGLRRIRHTVELKDTPAARGMIHKVRHLVEVE